MSTTITDLADRTATALDIDDAAAQDTLEHFISQVEALDGRTIDPDDISADDADFLVEACRHSQAAGDMGTAELGAVEDTTARLSRADTTTGDADTARAERDRAIRDARGAGASIGDIAAAAGLTRAAVDDIR